MGCSCSCNYYNIPSSYGNSANGHEQLKFNTGAGQRVLIKRESGATDLTVNRSLAEETIKYLFLSKNSTLVRVFLAILRTEQTIAMKFAMSALHQKKSLKHLFLVNCNSILIRNSQNKVSIIHNNSFPLHRVYSLRSFNSIMSDLPLIALQW